MVRPIPSSSVVRLLHVEGGPLRPPLGPGVVRRVLGRHRRARRADAEPERLVELIAVDAQREGVAEVAVAQPLPDLGVGLEALVDVQCRVGAVGGRVQPDGVVALLLVLQEDRQLAEIRVALLPVVLAGDGAQVDDFQVLGRASCWILSKYGSWFPSVSTA